MKYLLTVLAALFCLHLGAQQRTCFTPEQVAPQMASLDPDPGNGCYPFTMYVEVDYPLHLIAESRGIAIEAYMDGYLEEERKLFEADGLDVSFIVEYWKTPSPYIGTSTGAILDQFKNKLAAQGGHPGDLAQLVSNLASGGINYVDVLCNNSFGVGYSSINMEYLPYPEYSWDLLVFAHEAGHGLGSPHSHSCSWPGGAIDGCSPFGVEGNCVNPGVPNNAQNSIMSYCHLQSSAGIDLSYGFGPLPLALIKNKIASANCVECEDDPDEPEPEVCEENQVIVEVLVDLWAQETTWEVLNESGQVVYASTPYPKFPVNSIYADTLCLPEGCYEFKIKDVDGLAGVIPGYEGMYILNGEYGELISGQDFEEEELKPFCVGNVAPPNTCSSKGPYRDSLESYANQDRTGGVSVFGENFVKLSGNTWKVQPLNYTVTPLTVLYAQVKVEQLGEIHAFAFSTDPSGISPSTTLRFAGTQAWGREVAQVPTGQWVDIVIPVGQLIPNVEYSHLGFVNDYDPDGVAVTGFRNIELCEDGTGQMIKSAAIVEGSIKDEVVVEDIVLRPYPNPVTDTVILPAADVWFLFASDGKPVGFGHGKKVDMSFLPPGLYLIYQGGRTQKIIKQ